MASIKLKTQIPGPRSKELMNERLAHVARGPFNLTPVFLKKAHGALIEDVDGNTFIDLAAGIGVVNVGHTAEKVVKAIQERAADIIHCGFNVTPHESYIQLCKELNRITPGSHAKKTMLVNSGAEAVENAIKIARAATGRQAVICFEHGFHGRTYMAMTLTSKAKPYKIGFGPFNPEVYRAPFPYAYRWAGTSDTKRVADECFAKFEELVNNQVGAVNIAAVIFEPVLGEGGFVPASREFCAKLREFCDRNGSVLIADEIQTGFGRTGTLFACEQLNLVPDLMTLAKGLGAGMPIGAVTGKAAIMDGPADGGVGGTYGGNPLACAAALTVIDLFKDGTLLAKAAKLGQTLQSRMRQWHEKFPIIGDVRGMGPMHAIELVKDRTTKEPASEATKALAKHCYENGVIMLTAGTYGNVVRVLAPLVIDDDQLNEALAVVEDGLGKVGLVRSHKLFIEGRWIEGEDKARDIGAPFDQQVVAHAHYASQAQLERALAAGHTAFERFRKTSRFARARLLEAMRDGIARRRQDLAQVMALEAGKPITTADAEVGRALTTFTVAAEEAKRFGGEVLPIDIDAAGRAYDPAVVHWVPRGLVLGITPFNFPVNLVAHKVAPALAAGCSIIIKPAPQAPGGAVLLAEIFEEALGGIVDARDEIPLATFQIVSCSNELAERLVADRRVQTLSFTGSAKVGWMLQSKAVGKKLALELGGNAGVIVHSDADVARAALRCAQGGNAYAGQTCISVQRILVHRSLETKFTELLATECGKLASGDPLKRETVVGPLIDSGAADRVMSWIDEAKKRGAQVVCGGTRTGNVVAPTVLTKVPRDTKVSCEEVFGPVVVVEAYDKFTDALAAINDSRYGLQAGVFTDSQTLIRQAVDALDVGGVMINEIPTYRADQMPYGGVKDSGLGREGLRYAMEEYSERKVVVSWRG